MRTKCKNFLESQAGGLECRSNVMLTA